MKILVAVLCISIFSACSSIPDKLKVDESVNLVEFSSAQVKPDAAVGQMARWGGVIANVTNNADNSMMEVVYFPLSSSAKPLQKKETQGRFRLYFDGLLDPVVYKKGRSMTALGTVKASEDGKIGEFEYSYPVINSKNIQLWKEVKDVDVRVLNDPFWHSPSYWNYPYNRYYGYRGVKNYRVKAKSSNGAGSGTSAKSAKK